MEAVVEVLLVTLLVDITLITAAQAKTHTTTQVTQQRSLCLGLGGECLRPPRSCDGQTLPSRLCWSRGETCCVKGFEIFIKTFRKPLKRIPARGMCHKTTNKCKRRGGECIFQDTQCNTYAARKFCSGYYCTCCFGDHKDCTPTPACNGGFCFKGIHNKLCRGGKIIHSGCTGKKCSCCIPKGSQGSNPDPCSTCGKINKKRIVGGEEVTPPHKFPWLVGLRVPPYKQNYCGGTIISSTHVLTAGHCLYDHSNGNLYDPSEIKVRVGDHNQFSDLDDVEGVTEVVDVEEIIVHDLFSPNRPYHDIGLLRLKTKLDITSHPQVRAVCLPSNSDVTYEGANGVAIGWGVKTENSFQVSDVAQEVIVPILGPSCKNTQFGDVTFTSNMVCAGALEGGKDTCLGDSGGPINVKEYNRYVIVGITSFGIGCGHADYPGVYTRITAYLSWINSNLEDTCTVLD